MALLELPHWLMMAGALLVGAGLIGVLVSRRKADEIDPPPDEAIDLPALPLVNSKSNNKVTRQQAAARRRYPRIVLMHHRAASLG
ncbi:hypothetical protein ACFKHW_21230 [Bradyrhizobium lupini]|uniref:hypothetical protein n=1 Tax=Rhizobium lupini TaxID=136996 RepID=UPI00366DC848